MSELFLNKARTLAVTGHRILSTDFNKQALKEKLTAFIEKGFDTFLIGMALGFDTVCFQVLEELKKEYKNVKLIACIPCLSQSYKFNKEQKKEYDRMLSNADEKVLISEEYTSTCMQKRNRYMVDNSCALLAYIKRDFGGTAKTVSYAKKTGVPIVEIN